MLLAICDSNHKFLYINVGGFGSESDGSILKRSKLGQMLDRGQINIPDPELVEGQESGALPIPYFLLGDGGFPLKSYLMTPFSGTDLEESKFQHNKELSRGRSVIENSFGVLAARWHIYNIAITANPEKIDLIIKATTVLHNFLCEESRLYKNRGFTDHERNGVTIEGGWRRELPPGGSLFQPIPPNIRLGPMSSTVYAISIRNEVKNIIFRRNANLI